MTLERFSFTTIRNYITLKLRKGSPEAETSFTTIRNYITLKLHS